MLQRMFGRRRSVGEEEALAAVAAAGEEEFVLLGGDGLPAYSLEGATAFTPRNSVSSTPTTLGRSNSNDDPLEGVPFKLTVRTSDGPCIDVAEAGSIMEKIKNTNWDDYEYNFSLERGVLNECNSKLQTALIDGLSSTNHT